MYLVTCPIFLNQNYSNASVDEIDARGYRFYANVFERINAKKNMGSYPDKYTKRLENPDPEKSGSVFETKGLQVTEKGVVVNDTTYLGRYTFQNAYYGRNEEGVLIQIEANVPSKQTSVFSREMLISSLILKPHVEGEEDTQNTPSEDENPEAKMRKDTKSIIISNKHN